MTSVEQLCQQWLKVTNFKMWFVAVNLVATREKWQESLVSLAHEF